MFIGYSYCDVFSVLVEFIIKENLLCVNLFWNHGVNYHSVSLSLYTVNYFLGGASVFKRNIKSSFRGTVHLYTAGICRYWEWCVYYIVHKYKHKDAKKTCTLTEAAIGLSS